jgi:hypothetical protein
MTRTKEKTIRLRRRPGLGWFLWPLPALLAFLAQRLLQDRPELVERYHARLVFRFLSRPIALVTSAVPFSLTEVLLLGGGLLLAVLFLIWLIRLFRQTHRLRRVALLLRGLAWTASLAYLVFMLLHGLNYARLPVASSFDLPVRERDNKDLATAAVWLIDQANELRESRREDPDGVFMLRLGVQEALADASAGYSRAAAEYPLLAGPAIRPKSVIVSPYWSYTGISGLYFPFFVESNINTDMPDYQIPAAALHEIAHTRGFAREDEAGFIAFLTGVSHPNPDYAYSVLLDAAVRCLNQLAGDDPALYDQTAKRLGDAAWQDLAAGAAYWKRFEGPVEQASTQINNAYLQANLQKDGVRSYGRMLDLVLAWHEAAKNAGTLDDAVVSMNLDAARSKAGG